MPDNTLSLAIREAYASAPAGTITYLTLEMWHPAFTAPVRVVRDYENLTATLELSAPRDPGAQVVFTRFAFDFTKPEVSSAGVPQVTLTMDNVDRTVVANIEAATGSIYPIKVILREYLSTDLSAPQNDPPLAMTIMTINADVFRVTATAGFPNLMNKRFPTTAYTSEVFKGLV